MLPIAYLNNSWTTQTYGVLHYGEKVSELFFAIILMTYRAKKSLILI